MSDLYQKPLQCLRCVLEVLFDREMETLKTRFFVPEGSLMIATLVSELRLLLYKVPTLKVAIRGTSPDGGCVSVCKCAWLIGYYLHAAA